MHWEFQASDRVSSAYGFISRGRKAISIHQFLCRSLRVCPMARSCADVLLMLTYSDNLHRSHAGGIRSSFSHPDAVQMPTDCDIEALQAQWWRRFVCARCVASATDKSLSVALDDNCFRPYGTYSATLCVAFPRVYYFEDLPDDRAAQTAS